MPLVPDNGPYPWEQRPDLSLRETEYLVFRELQVKTKTRFWTVESKRHGDILGHIQWHGHWRQYVIHADAIFNKGCLNDITQFLEDAMTDWRERKKEERGADSSARPAGG